MPASYQPINPLGYVTTLCTTTPIADRQRKSAGYRRRQFMIMRTADRHARSFGFLSSTTYDQASRPIQAPIPRQYPTSIWDNDSRKIAKVDALSNL